MSVIFVVEFWIDWEMRVNAIPEEDEGKDERVRVKF